MISSVWAECEGAILADAKREKDVAFEWCLYPLFFKGASYPDSRRSGHLQLT